MLSTENARVTNHLISVKPSLKYGVSCKRKLTSREYNYCNHFANLLVLVFNVILVIKS